MSAPSEPHRSKIGPPDGPLAAGAPAGDTAAMRSDTEEIDALPVLAHGPTVVRAYPLARELPSSRRVSVTVIPAVQAAAVAAGGFVAGAAVVGLVHRRHRQAEALSKGRRAGRGLGRAARGNSAASRSAGELVQIVGSRSLLVDVHLLGGRD